MRPAQIKPNTACLFSEVDHHNEFIKSGNGHNRAPFTGECVVGRGFIRGRDVILGIHWDSDLKKQLLNSVFFSNSNNRG